ncbi:hypothetical protein C8Q70DRAFT_988192 [Cubamyces menziesii]|nr:hypothetical protein C8Q70DRAFT_988192 [Cubamyces menziesii]
MAPRRPRSQSTIQGPVTPHNGQLPTQRTQTPGNRTQRQLGMPLAVYQSNMKVLARREPSITAIIDQFSHVCLYHYNGQKWEKHGYEGSMFLYEKTSYPTYGFYILNRMGTDDYVRPIYPEDDMEIMGDYLMYRFYPDFTKTRLEMGLPYPIPQEHSSAFERELSRRAPPDEKDKEPEKKDKEKKEKKGRSIILGLWMFPTDAREPLKEVMMRLHSYVKRGAPYPDEFKYGPGRPPLPNPHLHTASRTSIRTPSQDQGVGVQMSRTTGDLRGQSQPSFEQATAASAGAGNELDRLFAKLLPSSVSAPLPTGPSVGPSSTSKSVHDLFAALGGPTLGTQSAPPPQFPATHSTQSILDAAASSQSRHMSDRNSHFDPHLASRDIPSPRPVHTSTAPSSSPPRGQALLQSIFASVTPAASSSSLNSQAAPPPPQPEAIDIVSPKPTSSALPQILDQDVISKLLGLGPDSRASSAAPSSVGSRRSNQNRYEGDNEFSEGDLAPENVPSWSSTVDGDGRARQASLPTFSVQRPLSSESESDGGRPSSARRVPGDVTPRPPAGGLRLPPTSPPHASAPTTSVSAPNLNGQTNGTPSSAPRERTLVPFEANSELWPYPRAPLDDRSFENDDVVELDFSDTRALSDPAIFTSRLKEKQKKGKGKKSKKEREEDRERERAQIEKSWDMPTNGHTQPPYPSHASGPAAPASTTTSAGANVASTSKAAKQGMNGATNGVNGSQHVNGHSRSGSLDNVAAKEAILSAMSAQGHPSSHGVPKKQFVQELLSLIHTDARFVDSLWQDYLSRAA